MNKYATAALARRLMIEHGLGHWTFQFDNAKRRFGQCRFGTQTISLSAPLCAINDEARVRNTILHEIAHALVGPGHGHDIVWRLRAREIGCDGRRCADGSDVAAPAHSWTGRCPSCSDTIGRHRLTEKAQRVACSACCRKYNGGRYDARFKFEWRKAA